MSHDATKPPTPRHTDSHLLRLHYRLALTLPRALAPDYIGRETRSIYTAQEEKAQLEAPKPVGWAAVSTCGMLFRRNSGCLVHIHPRILSYAEEACGF